jgi:hypothetical protein
MIKVPRYTRSVRVKGGNKKTKETPSFVFCPNILKGKDQRQAEA